MSQDTQQDTRQLDAVIAQRERDLAQVLMNLESKKVQRAQLDSGIIQDTMTAKGFAKELRQLGGRRNVRRAKQFARVNGNGNPDRSDSQRGNPDTSDIRVKYPSPPDLVTNR